MKTDRISRKEHTRYTDILKQQGSISLQDIVFCACKFELYADNKKLQKSTSIDDLSDDNKLFTAITNKYTSFSKNFSRILHVFGIWDGVFKKGGKHKAYQFTLREALFIRRLWARVECADV